jgi:NADH pyrophosphatase NudC (nudix superfamily)
MLLLGIFLAAVTHPILTRGHVWQRATGSRRQVLELTEHKEQLYASIKELEFDHSLGKMSAEDYGAVRGGLEAEAVEVLQRLDQLADANDAGVRLDERIEADIASHRGALATTTQPATNPAAHAFCHSCGEKRDAAFRFCPHCGQSFTPTSS